MHATSSYQDSGSKVVKIAIVTLLHAGVAIALLSMRIAAPSPDKSPALVMLDPTVKVVPPEPPTPVEAPPTATPPLYVPPTAIASTAETPPLTTTSEFPSEPLPTSTGPKAIIDDAPPPAVPHVAEKALFRVAQSGNCPAPTYPATSARNGDSGTVGLALLIGPNGRVSDAKVVSTSGFRELDRAAVAALSLCTFKPATSNGVPESAWGKIAYVWTLDQ